MNGRIESDYRNNSRPAGSCVRPIWKTRKWFYSTAFI